MIEIRMRKDLYEWDESPMKTCVVLSLSQTIKVMFSSKKFEGKCRKRKYKGKYKKQKKIKKLKN